MIYRNLIYRNTTYRNNSCSSFSPITVTPNSRALSNFDPASLPATT